MIDLLYNLIIMPIEVLVESIYYVMNHIIGNQGLAIIAVSLVVQSLILPLYKKSDMLQAEERDKQKEMSYWVNHIRKTFRGDERVMMLLAYYRQQNYKPYYAMKSSISILLQIPFFIAAYHFLSNLDALNGSSFLFIKDLGKPDNLFSINGFEINFLPILMTVINIISGIIYTKGFPLKSKIQVYGLALFFLIILYNSPSGLVLYWTMNNVYSLLKNIFIKWVKHPLEVISIAILVLGAGFTGWSFSRGASHTSKMLLVLLVCSQIPMMITVFRKRFPQCEKSIESLWKKNSDVKGVFFWEAGSLTLFMGALIPLNIISASATEFVSVSYGPFEIIAHCLCVYAGLFLIWGSVFYALMTPKARYLCEIVLFAVLGMTILNYMGFGRNLGRMSPLLQYDNPPAFSRNEIVINLLTIFVLVCVLVFVMLRHSFISMRIVQILCISVFIICIVNVGSIHQQLKAYNKSQSNLAGEDAQIIHLSQNGTNVIVLMLDRAISGYVPYLFEEKPELKEAFSGFTYYPNTLSFGGYTNFGTPALFGGYEYTPTEMNKRANESLKDKHNEALTVMPRVFSESGYSVTVCDPPYAGYTWVPDLSIYDDYAGIDAYITEGAYSTQLLSIYAPSYGSKQESNFIYYSMMRALPLVCRNSVYNSGMYFSTSVVAINPVFVNSYSVLSNLTEITDITDDDQNHFLMMQNSTTHEATFLKTPEYIPAEGISILGFSITDAVEGQEEREIDGNVLKIDNKYQLAHYQVNMAAMITLGEWFNYLKGMGCYDNTKIIIVADHGLGLGQFDYMVLENGIDVQFYNPLLLVKDFNSTEFTVSEEFMTNADVPIIAFEDVVKNPVNPFTDKVINNQEKYLHPQVITTSHHWDTEVYNGNVFDTSDGEWFAVKDNIFDVRNWEKVE